MNWYTEQETSNQMHPGLNNKKLKQNAPQARIFDEVLMGTLSYF